MEGVSFRAIRIGVDLLVVFVHALAVGLCGGLAGTDWSSSPSGALLITVEAIAIVAHLAYVFLLSSDESFATKRNLYKWAEYGSSQACPFVSAGSYEECQG